MTLDTAQTVDRSLVHRAALAEVFLTQVEQRGDQFVGTAQLPRSHAFYTDHLGEAAGTYDPMMVTEAARQCGIAVAHSYFDAALDSAFLLRTLDGHCHPDANWQIGNLPAELSLVTTVLKQYGDTGAPAGLHVRVDAYRDGQLMMENTSKFSWIPPHDWNQLRRNARSGVGLPDIAPHPTPHCGRAEPAQVGRMLGNNVVISPPELTSSAACADLVCDPGNATIFDHIVDHVPGSLQVEACRQLSTALLGQDFKSAQLQCFRSRFEGFAELDLPSRIVAHRESLSDGVARVLFRIEQGEQTPAHFGIDYRVTV